MIRITTFLLVFAFTSVSLRWKSEHFLPWSVRLGGAVVIVAGAILLSRRRSRFTFRRVLRWPADDRSLAVGLAGIAAVLSASFAYFILEPFPHIEDEAAYYFQAKVFSSGALVAPTPEGVAFFRSPWVLEHDGRWFSVFPPGWPLLLALGLLAGLPALLNPLLGGFCVFVVYTLVREVSGRRHALYATTFCVLSPFFLFMAASFMSHMALLLFITVSTLGHIRAVRQGELRWFATSGLAAGAAVLIRPLDAIAIWGAQALHGLWMFKLRHIGGLTLSGTGLALGAALYVSYNRIIMGEWFLQPLNLVSSAHRLGFGPDIGLNWDTFDTPGHTPWRALLNLNFNLAVLSQDLFGWPLSSLLFVIAFWTIGRDRSDYLLSGLIMLTVVGAYTLYWYHGVAFGARFYFCLLPHLLISTVKGIESVLALLAKWTPHALEHTMARAVWASVGLSFAFGWLVYVPKVGLLGPYHDQRGINSGLYRFVERQGLASAIVFVRVPRQNLFGPAFIANDVPPWSSSVLFALDRGAANQWLIDRFPQRSVHYFSYAPELNPYREFWDRLTWRSDRWPNGPLKK